MSRKPDLSSEKCQPPQSQAINGRAPRQTGRRQ